MPFRKLQAQNPTPLPTTSQMDSFSTISTSTDCIPTNNESGGSGNNAYRIIPWARWLSLLNQVTALVRRRYALYRLCSFLLTASWDRTASEYYSSWKYSRTSSWLIMALRLGWELGGVFLVLEGVIFMNFEFIRGIGYCTIRLTYCITLFDRRK